METTWRTKETVSSVVHCSGPGRLHHNHQTTVLRRLPNRCIERAAHIYISRQGFVLCQQSARVCHCSASAALGAFCLVFAFNLQS